MFSPSPGYLGGSIDSVPGSFSKVCVCLLFLSQSCKTLTGKNFDLWLKDKSNFLKSVRMLSAYLPCFLVEAVSEGATLLIKYEYIKNMYLHVAYVGT